MGPYRRQSTKYHHSKPYRNPEKETSEEGQDSNVQGTSPFVSSSEMVESPISMTLNIQIAIKSLGIDALRELMTNTILPAAEASFTKDQKSEVELRFKEKMMEAREALGKHKTGDKLDENDAVDKGRQELADEIIQENSTGRETDGDGNTNDDEYDEDDDGDEEEEEPELSKHELQAVEAKIAQVYRERSLRMQLKLLDQAVRTDWKDGWEEQGEMMEGIVKEIGEWCQDLFEIAFIKRVKISEIDECLQTMHDVMEELSQSDSRTEFNDSSFSLSIYHNKRLCYATDSGPVLLVLFWRDLALVALTYKWVSYAENIVEEIHSRGQFEELKEVVRPEEAETMVFLPSKTGVKHTNQRTSYQDEWHSEDMKAALPRLRKIILDLEIMIKKANRAKKQKRYGH